jgi:hypothetical protein
MADSQWKEMAVPMAKPVDFPLFDFECRLVSNIWLFISFSHDVICHDIIEQESCQKPKLM